MVCGGGPKIRLLVFNGSFNAQWYFNEVLNLEA